MAAQPQAKAFLSPAVAELGKAMLHNSVNVMQSKRIELGMTEYPLFDHRELDFLEARFETRAYNRPFDLDRSGRVRATFHDAGHILGSAGVMIEAEGKRLFYTGDVKFDHQSLSKGALFPEEPVDALIIETTRGEKSSRVGYTRESEEQKLAEIIARTLLRGGSVLIPVFAMGKTQEVLTMVHHFKQDGRIPDYTPVYIGGLSTKMTVIFDEFASDPRRRYPGFRLLKDMEIQTGNRRSRKPIPNRPGCIYALSSGMMSEKTVSNIFAREFITKPQNTLIFVGYADPETPGGKIRVAERGSHVVLDPALSPVLFNCDLEVLDFSGHAQREDLLDYILKLAPPKVFLVHGDAPASQWFVDQLAIKLPNSEVVIPLPGEPYTI
jgi:Cft2 family RNA processing exonuclease